MKDRTRVTPQRPIRRHDAPGSEFNFDTADFSVPVPESIPATQRSNALPFRRWFTNYAGPALEGKQPHLFVPTRFWVEARGADAEKVTERYQKDKLKGQYDAWRKSEEAPKDAERLKLTLIYRTGQEEIEGIAEPGISLWLTAPASKG